MKIQQNFLKAVCDLDSDERITDGALIGQPKNITIFISEGSGNGNGGVLKNCTGNVLKTAYNIVGAETIGSGKNESGDKLYDFIKGTGYDYVIEYNALNGAYAVVLQATTGGLLNFISGERITNFDYFIDGTTGFSLIAWSGDSNPPRLVNVETAKTWAIDGFTNTEISVMKTSPIFAPTLNLTTSTDGIENNFIEDKFIVFATSYVYADDMVSAFGSWSEVAFEPSPFELDFQTQENKGMLNLSNAVNVSFNSGDKDVIAVNLLFRESNKTNVYVIQKFIKAEEGWADNTTQTFQFSKSKIYTILAEEQYYRNFDNVPLSALAQTQAGNRLMYANYLEGRDLGVVIDFDVALTSTNPVIADIDGEIVDVTGVTTYANVVDFTEGNADGGSAPVDQMDYATNTVAVDLAGDPDKAKFRIEVTPQAGYSSVPYNIIVKDGATTVQSWTNLTGINVKNYQTDTNQNIRIFITSNDGLIYALDLRYSLIKIIGLVESDVSVYEYFSYFQLVYPKNGGYGATLVGDIVIDTKANYDLTGFVFRQGNQIRINFDLVSSLVKNFRPSVTFFYNLTQNYADLTDFITNSSFKTQFETVFSLDFKTNQISNAGTLVSYTDFSVTNVGDIMTIQTPKVVYNVTEPSTVVENKNEFYLIDATDLQSVNSNGFRSLHSNRDDEVALIYMDEQGRKTTALNCKQNTINIPSDKSDATNVLEVTINNPPPAFAKYYKFAIKKAKREYDTIYGNEIYKDGIYRWIKLVGENKNKVNAGDLLIVKTDYAGVLPTLTKVKVLEITNQASNFIAGNVLENGDELIEEGGLYFKIKQGSFDANITNNSFKTYSGHLKRRYASNVFVTTEPFFGEFDVTTPTLFVPTPVKSGTLIRFKVELKAFGAIAFDHLFETNTFSTADYGSMQEWWEAEVEISSEWTDFANNYLKDYQWGADSRNFSVKSWRDGTASRDIIVDVVFDVNFAGGILVFETEPIEQLSSPYFETPKVYTIVNGQHQFITHVLDDAFDCFSFGNGVESYKILDGFTQPSFAIDSNATDVDLQGYKQLRRFADITYSETYNSTTNVNRLNEFNLSLANYKDDIEKSWGAIIVMKGFETNIELIQEDKYSIVYYGKDLLYNADGTTNLTGVPQVLGQQDALNGEFGCQNISSFDFYGFTRYFVDVKRGSVLKKTNNGLFEISGQGMRSYFKTLFRDKNVTNIIGQYDQFYDVFMLNIKYNDGEYLTWMYSDTNNGWLGTQTFNPEDMIRLKGDFYTFKNGEVYLHNQELDGSTPNYNTFYGQSFESEASFNFSQDASENKIFKALEIEGSTPVQIALETNLDLGYINQSDFEKKEGYYYSYVRGSNAVLDTSLLTSQGIGDAVINGLNLDFVFPNGGIIDPIISVGDVIMNLNEQVVGTILSKTDNTLTLDTVNNLNTGDFVFSLKPNSVNGQGILGYYSKVTMTFSSAVRQEIFSVGCEISISNPV